MISDDDYKKALNETRQKYYDQHISDCITTILIVVVLYWVFV